MKVRRVVTGQAADGKSRVVSDSAVDAVTISMLPGAEFHAIWGSDELPALPADGSRPAAPRWFPPAGGYRFAFFTLGPDTQTMPEDLDMQAAMAELEQKLPGLADPLEPDHPGMHTTDTVDFDLVLSGEVWLELDDGEEVLLKPGDCVIQNGTRHAWRNRSDASCVLAVALIGATRKP